MTAAREVPDEVTPEAGRASFLHDGRVRQLVRQEDA
jgi:hypothetical protein